MISHSAMTAHCEAQKRAPLTRMAISIPGWHIDITLHILLPTTNPNIPNTEAVKMVHASYVVTYKLAISGFLSCP